MGWLGFEKTDNLNFFIRFLFLCHLFKFFFLGGGQITLRRVFSIFELRVHSWQVSGTSGVPEIEWTSAVCKSETIFEPCNTWSLDEPARSTPWSQSQPRVSPEHFWMWPKNKCPHTPLLYKINCSYSSLEKNFPLSTWNSVYMDVLASFPHFVACYS